MNIILSIPNQESTQKSLVIISWGEIVRDLDRENSTEILLEIEHIKFIRMNLKINMNVVILNGNIKSIVSNI